LLHSRDFDTPDLGEIELRHLYERTLKRSAQLRDRRTRRRAAGGITALACLLAVGLVAGSLAAVLGQRAKAPAWRLVSEVSAASSSWRELSPPGYEQTFSLVCPSDTTCYADSVGGQLEYTHDGGSTWQRAGSIGTGTLLTRISCVDARDCDVLADNTGRGSAFFTTADGGQSWTSHHGPAVADPSKNSVATDAMSCTTILSCVVIAYHGDSSGASSAAFTTSDGGATWSQGTLPSPASGQFVPTRLNCSGASCVAVGAAGIYEGASQGVYILGGAAYVSDDGGATWAASSGLWKGLTRSLTCPDSADCYAAALGAVYQTKDGGRVWSPVSTSGLPGPSDSSSRWNFLAMSCASSSACWLSGASKLPANPRSLRAFFSIGQAQGLLASTADGGATWALSMPPAGVGGVADVTCPDTTTCFALGIKQVGSAPNDFTVVLLTNAGQRGRAAGPAGR
jgi:photosystem II stability/assembly factor-like uncharacterized protein